MMKIIEIMADWGQEVKNATNNIPKNTDLTVTTVLNWVYAFAGVVATGFIVYGAVNYVMTQGDPGKIKQAGQTIAFAVIMIAFVMIMAGLGSGNDTLCTIGFVLIVVAMLYSPVKVHILDRKKK
jgi:hypothetical protein